MIDFTNMPRRYKSYTGANGKKISVVYNDQTYMIKFPSTPNKNHNISYTNSCISEYIGCKIFQSVGISTQEVELGLFTTHENREKVVVVACKDFAYPHLDIQDFASIKNQVISSKRNGYGTELVDILHTIEEQNMIDSQVLYDHFWDMFIVDALIGNWDRHNGNWGFLYNPFKEEISLAPIFDCASSLFPQVDDTLMDETLNTKQGLYKRVFNLPTSAIMKNGKRINYYDFISSLEYTGCNEALKRICSKIDINKINRIIDSTPFISDKYRDFLKVIIQARKERILDFSLRKLNKSGETTETITAVEF